MTALNPAQLQRVAVRMRFDPALVASVYERGEDLLPGRRLDPRALELLTGPARALWSSDRYLRSRKVTSWIRHFPTACAWSLALSPQRTLEGFFSDADFHEAVMERRGLTQAFGRWLATSGDELVPRSLALIEAAVHAGRVSLTAPRPDVEGGVGGGPGARPGGRPGARPGARPGERPGEQQVTRWALRPGVRVCEVPAGSSTLMGWTRHQLEACPEGLTTAVVEGRWRRANAPDLGPTSEQLLLTFDAEGAAALGKINDAMFQLLRAVDGGLHDLAPLAARLEVSTADIHEVLEDLRSDGLVVSVPHAQARASS